MGLDTVELVMAVEDEYNLRVPDDIAATLSTVGALHRYIYSEVRHRPSCELTSSQVFNQIRDLISDITGIPIEKITAESRFVDDLKMD